MLPDPPTPSYSTKRLILCSRENALRVAAQIFGETRWACVIRTGHPLQPFRAAATATHDDEVETLLFS